MLNLKEQHIMILGLGDSGLSMARWCDFCGAHVWVVDNREAPPRLAELKESLPRVEFITSVFDSHLLERAPFKAVFKSPGLSPDQVRGLWESAKASGLVTGGELTLFAQALEDMERTASYAPKVLAITGTNGKTTVTTLTGLLLERAGLKVEVAGNIGPAMLEQLLAYLKPDDLDAMREDRVRMSSVLTVQESFDLGDAHEIESLDTEVSEAEPNPDELGDLESEEEVAAHLDLDAQLPESVSISEEADSTDLDLPIPLTPEVVLPDWVHALPQAWVLELSSFQLDGVNNFKPTMATVLNVTQDHLDWHGSFDHYKNAKAQIFSSSTLRLINRDDPHAEFFIPKPELKEKAAFGRTKLKAPQWVEFGSSEPTRVGDFGIEVVNGMSWLVKAEGNGDPEPKKASLAQEALKQIDHMKRLMPAEALRIHGKHNAANALAALALASSTGAPMGGMLYALREYSGEPHRIQSLQIIDGVEYFDDSKGTNVGATVAALEGLGGERSLVLILGGLGKGQDFTPLLQPVKRFVKALVLMGQDAELIAQALKDSQVPMHRVPSMQEAVRVSAQCAKSGDAVLLSPACASMDMFKDYAHRASAFASAVEALAWDAPGASHDASPSIQTAGGEF
jgi:UDP-N-acetylmuramoylalanine--D-glutamate ligase